MILKYIVNNNKYTNINQILKDEFKLSSRLLLKLIKNKKIFLNGNIIDTRYNVHLNDIVTVLLDLEEDNSNIIPSKMDLNIIYEDDGLLVLNKPAGIAIHPSILHFSDTLSNGVKYYFDKIKLKKKIRPVNRLDLNTSGLVIFAKNEYIQECLIKQMIDGSFKKEYIAIVDGILENKKGIINAPISRKENSIIERCVSSNGKPSITHYEVLKEFSVNSIVENSSINQINNHLQKSRCEISVVKCTLETGRTHQIRVHMAYIGHPLLGDTLYGTASNFISRQALHCNKLSFINPINKTMLELKSELPQEFNNIKSPMA